MSTVLVTGSSAALAAPSRCAWRTTATTSCCIAAPSVSRPRPLQRRSRRWAARLACCSSTWPIARPRPARCWPTSSPWLLLRHRLQCRHRRDGAFPALSGEDWDAVIHTNLDAFYNVLQPLTMPLVRRKAAARIVTLASVSGIMGNRGQVNYSAAKAGIIGATKALAVELASRKITVNCVAPGLIETDMVDPALVEEALKIIPARRVGRPEEVAAVVSFLMGEDAAYITRQVISVNGEGGMSGKKRVVITGIGALSPLGHDAETVLDSLRARDQQGPAHGGVGRLRRPQHAGGSALRALRASGRTLQPQEHAQHGSRAQMATRSAELALEQAGLIGDPLVTSGRLGVSFGSSSGTPSASATSAA